MEVSQRSEPTTTSKLAANEDDDPTPANPKVVEKSPDAITGRSWVLILLFAVLLQVALYRAVVYRSVMYPTRESLSGDRTASFAKTAVPPRLRIRLNFADQRELEILPRVGPRLAARIIEYRNANYPITDASQILGVSGIGPTRLAEIANFLDLDIAGANADALPKEAPSSRNTNQLDRRGVINFGTDKPASTQSTDDALR